MYLVFLAATWRLVVAQLVSALSHDSHEVLPEWGCVNLEAPSNPTAIKTKHRHLVIFRGLSVPCFGIRAICLLAIFSGVP
ncbi:hypothetical protein I79_013710 [Cricetulus griseus]|uniref:Secreted protein n=1 Tax=Cricetulus griseus TaxID=10029 RepID=G3HS85_CRIGR|nr:hypothetical protein I79_013710 [Cricetulus griseus]